MGRLRKLRAISAVALAGGVAATLAGGATALASPSAKSVARASSSAPFVVADSSSVQKLDPDIITNFLDFQSLGLIYDTLVEENPKLQVAPDLATSWTFSNGNKALTFQLRKGVKFDDGSTFTSADVVASLKRVQAPKTGDASASFISSLSKVVPEGPYAVKLVLSHPDVSILEGLTSLNLAMLPAKAIANGSIAKKPDGTGPFKFSSWSPGNSFTVVRNPSYWGGKPALSTIKIETVPSEQSIASALQAHSVQLGLLTEPQVATHLPSTYKVQKVLSLSYRALMLQDKTGPLANVNARRAIACATNRKQIVGDAVFGQGVAVGPVPLGPFASNPVSSLCPTQNISMAKSYLKAAGMPNGFSFTAITSTDLDPTSSAQAVAMQSQLAQAGITMNIQNLAGDAYIQDWLKGNFQAAFAENGADPDPYVMYGRYFGTGANLGVPAGYSSPALQKLILQGDEAASTPVQTKLWSSLSANLTNNAVWIWLFDAFNYAAVAPNVHGFSLSPVVGTSLQALRSTTIS
ncbi:MAG: putative D,D-dipeptide-binding periplasmic protein DdpA [Acidimicrobiaceae bacterium]|jgi:peptide/nickel transport system substrate-binding protein|nr:putative D,D-dipeptide-binding periplasmic protein DdpA [Acidimicrobiaceae bacterium]